MRFIGGILISSFCMVAEWEKSTAACVWFFFHGSRLLVKIMLMSLFGYPAFATLQPSCFLLPNPGFLSVMPRHHWKLRAWPVQVPSGLFGTLRVGTEMVRTRLTFLTLHACLHVLRGLSPLVTDKIKKTAFCDLNFSPPYKDKYRKILYYNDTEKKFFHFLVV